MNSIQVATTSSVLSQENPMNNQILNDTVHRLTRDHRSIHTDPETGKTSYPTELALFTQLRQEIASSSRPATGASSGPRIPVALQAVMLWDEIRESLNTVHITLRGQDDPKKSAERKLQEWAAWAGTDSQTDSAKKCLRDVLKWAAAIEQLLNPVRRVEIVGACPTDNCSASHVWAWDEGEYVRNTAITATGSEARCGACGTTWTGAELHTLALNLGTVAA